MALISDDLVVRFMQRFDGSKRSFGYFVPGEINAKGKMEGRTWTVDGAPTKQDWENHLNGSNGIRIVAVDNKGLCRWGAIDVDLYPLDLQDLENKITEYALPLTVCRTKSGGAHLYVFFSEPVEAVAVKSALLQWARLFNFPKKAGIDTFEIFPKEDSLGEESKGHALNLPYHHAENTNRYAIFDFKHLTLDEFLDHAESKQINFERLSHLMESDDPDLGGAPPCLKTLAKLGVQEGSRNNGLYNYGVLAKKKFPDSWKQKIDEYNTKFFKPSMRSSEVLGIIKSLEKKDYRYRCDDLPIVSVCDKSACKLCEFGAFKNKNIGVILRDLKKLETSPPIWYLKVNDLEIKISNTEDLLDMYRFRQKVFEELTILPYKIKQDEWDKELQTLIKDVVKIEAPDDASPRGQFLILVADFCNLRAAKASSKEDLLHGKVYADETHFHFHSNDLEDYLKQRRFSIKRNEMWAYLRSFHAEPCQIRLSTGRGSKNTKVWRVPIYQLDFSTKNMTRKKEDLEEALTDGF